MEECIFSGLEPDNTEHLIPKWLQRRFNLWDESLVLPNGSTSPYRQVTVPVKTECNAMFGNIENVLASGQYPKQEVFLWALKIHIGLIYRDSRLKLDRSSPTSPAILDVQNFAEEVWLFRQLYDVWSKSGSITPNPFGSVFILDSLLDPTEFDFFNCMITGTIGVNLGDKFVVVFLWDQGDAYNSNIMRQWETHHVPLVNSAPANVRGSHAYIAHHVWACESAYFLWRNRRSFNFLRTDNSLASVPALSRIPGKPVSEQQYALVCRGFGLELQEFNGESRNKYSRAS